MTNRTSEEAPILVVARMQIHTTMRETNTSHPIKIPRAAQKPVRLLALLMEALIPCLPSQTPHCLRAYYNEVVNSVLQQAAHDAPSDAHARGLKALRSCQQPKSLAQFCQ